MSETIVKFNFNKATWEEHSMTHGLQKHWQYNLTCWNETETNMINNTLHAEIERNQLEQSIFLYINACFHDKLFLLDQCKISATAN